MLSTGCVKCEDFAFNINKIFRRKIMKTSTIKFLSIDSFLIKFSQTFNRGIIMKKNLLRYLTCLFILVGIVLPGSVLAEPVLDQVNDPESTSGQAFIGPDNIVDWAETFTVGVTGILDSIEVRVRRESIEVTDPLLFDIRTTTNGTPTLSDTGENILFATSIPAETILTGYEWLFYSIDVSAASIPVSTGEVLAIVLRSDGSTASGDRAYRWLGGGSYAAGKSFSRIHSGIWTASLGDGWLTFKTFVQPVVANTPPVADAGDNQWKVGLSSVTLDGTRSWDPENDDITYMWTLQTPEESSAVLDDATSATPSFTADIYGYYYAALEVIDSNGMPSENNSHVAVSFYPPNQFSKLDSSFGSETITVDNQTDNKWLDLNLTTNRSYDEIVAEMLPGGEFEGFRHATTDEALELFSNAGFELTHGWARWNHNAFNYLVQYIGISFEIPGFPTMSGWTGDTTGTPPNVLVESVVAYKEDRPGNVTYQMGVAYDISIGLPSDFISESSGHWLIAGDGYTLPGINVEVSDEETGTTILFDVVTSGGNTTVTTTPQSQGPPPPTGLKLVPLGTYYEIHTTAEYAGIIQIAIKYDDTGLTTGQENTLKLRYYEEATDEWENITTGLDTVKNIIYAEISHLSFFAITMPILVEIDIKPGSYPNSINPNSGGTISVAILTTDSFDASSVIPETVALEGAGAREKGKSGRYGSMKDIDGDGDLDLVIHVVNDIYWAESATEATLTGMTWDGSIIEGTDSINIVSSK